MESDIRTRLEGLLDGLDDGEKLPSERKLVDELGVSRREIRNAFASLESEGQVWRETGRGTFKGGRPLDNRYGFAALKSLTNPREVMAARLLLEPELVKLAANRATTQDLEQMAQLLNKAHRSPDIATYSKWDSRFHKAIADAAKHHLFSTLYSVVDKLRSELSWGSLERRISTPEWIEQAQAAHLGIFLALENRDPGLAAKNMLEHLEAVYSVHTGTD